MSEKNNSDSGAGAASKVFNAIGAFAVTVFSAIGLLYVLRGNYLLVGFISILILIAIMFLSKYLIDNKRRKRALFNDGVKDTRTNSRTNEYILIGIYSVVAIVTLPFIFHFIDVDFSRKSELISAGVEKTATINNLLTAYNDKVIEFKNEFETSSNTHLSNYMLEQESASKDSLNDLLGGGENDIFDRYSDSPDESNKNELNELVDEAIKNGKNTIDTKYKLGKFETLSVQEHVKKYTTTSKNIFNNWKMMKVSDKYYDIDIYYNKLLKRINKKMPEFTYEKASSKDIKLDSAINSLTNASGITYLIGFVSFFVFHFLVLAEYFNAKKVESALELKKNNKNDKNNKNSNSIKF